MLPSSVKKQNYLKEWIINLGVDNVNLANFKKVLGYLKHALAMNSIIPLSKKGINNAMKKEQVLHIANIKTNIQCLG